MTIDAIPPAGELTIEGRLTIAGALLLLDDRALTIHDRAAIYSVLRTVKLTLHRRLSLPGEELKGYMEREGLRAMGNLELRSYAVGVVYTCNEPGNWGDAGIQERLETWAGDPATADYVREIPAHREIATAELGEAVALKVPDALAMHDELKARGWRTDKGRTNRLELKR